MVNRQSAIYHCQVMHQRMHPKRHRFSYGVYMVWLDLDEVDELCRQIPWLSKNRFNLFSLFDSDHVKAAGQQGLSISAKLRNWLSEQDFEGATDKIFLMTHLRVLGHVFNPVSFYYCYDSSGNCTCIVAEVSNTFGEMKMFLIDQVSELGFEQEADKFFYVSPFTELDDRFHFRFHLPGQQYFTAIDVSRAGQKYFYSVLRGDRKVLNSAVLLGYFFRMPLVTVKVITAIHWQAFRLWTRGLSYRKKAADPDKQKGILNEKRM
ncbi:MAG: DUF1365 domain-containing protein [Chitinophagales bacterium]|nr:DUF1365 domain-containing protein [Bacteroidota bacterium]HPE96730.1 DUF1365 domain-containing protein [Chitinophagales bacterium]HAE35379.1 DUF1365 domain-containing protein [Bacteroidota bacterium]HQU39322.1 DUF1365 domain-containing protein [Chitinophagales bacterium]HQU76960.1 DUF1365 domain-containing protein [Chitinophagales bacterium]